MPETGIIVFAKAPVAGQVKTRLIPTLGPVRAAKLAADLLRLTLHEACASGADTVTLATDPPIEHPAWRAIELPDNVATLTQCRGDLGKRMATAAITELREHQRILLVGSDCPTLTGKRMRASLTALSNADISITPASDGGYVSLALKRAHEELFTDMPWSQPELIEITLARAKAAGLRIDVQSTLPDIDRPADLEGLPDALAERYGLLVSEQEIA